MAYELIETVEVGAGGASSIEFTSIPQDGVDLVCVISSRANVGGISAQTTLSLNSSTSNNGDTYLIGAGTNVLSFGGLNTQRIYYTNANSSTANTFGNAQIYISNYASSANKSVSVEGVSEHKGTSDMYRYLSSLQYNISAITSLKLLPAVGYLEHSTASLYKIS